jgi:hypothetical protein
MPRDGILCVFQAERVFAVVPECFLRLFGHINRSTIRRIDNGLICFSKQSHSAWATYMVTTKSQVLHRRRNLLELDTADHSPDRISRTMNASSLSRTSPGQQPENNVHLSSASPLGDEMFDGKEKPNLMDIGRHLQLRKAERRVERGVHVTVTYTAPLPKSSGYYTDLMLGCAALQPNTSVSLRNPAEREFY